MIVRGQGNLLDADAEAIVNTVNCVGVMGKGVALLVKQAYPETYRQYRRACASGEVQPGRMLVVPTGRLGNPQYIINFPTKRYWKGKSRLEDIQAGLPALVEEVKRFGLQSIAVPALGCGNGGLDWAVVRPLIESAFAELPHVRVLLFEPLGVPPLTQAKQAATHSAAGRQREQADGHRGPLLPASATAGVRDPGRSSALLLHLMVRYRVPGYRLSLWEVQKLGYLLQAAGEPLSLRYVWGSSGPVATNLDALLQPLNRYCLSGLDPTVPDAEIELAPDASITSDRVITGIPDAAAHGARVVRLIKGFETPYGLELLAAVHWVAHERRGAVDDPESAVVAVGDQSDRTRRLMKPDHIRKAWRCLQDYGWLARATATVGAR